MQMQQYLNFDSRQTYSVFAVIRQTTANDSHVRVQVKLDANRPADFSCGDGTSGSNLCGTRDFPTVRAAQASNLNVYSENRLNIVQTDKSPVKSE
jgi:hypothetical protein